MIGNVASAVPRIYAKKRLATSIMHLRSQSNQGNVDSQADVLFKEVNDRAVITLNRPKALNALNVSMIEKIYLTLGQWNGKKKLILVKGNGQKAFCAGGDVKSIVVALNDPGGEKIGQRFFKTEYKTNHLVGTYKSPYVAIINGITMGGGVGMSVHGRYRIATETTLFAMPETAIGLFPDVGGTFFLPRLNGKLGYYLGLTGYRLKGMDTLFAGIATHYVPSKKLEDLTDALLRSDANDPVDIINKYQADDSNQEFSLAPYLKQIDECFSAPTVLGIVQRLEADGSEWAKQTLELLSKMSPTALNVTFKAIETGARQSLAECLKMEYRLAHRSLDKNSDFCEGVRALLIDKDQKPAWKPKTLQEVSASEIEARFSKLSEDEELMV